MKHAKNYFLIFIILITFTSCQTCPGIRSETSQEKFEALREIKMSLSENVVIGKSTKEDILKLGGKPDLKMTIDISEAELFSKRILGGKDIALERWSYMTSSRARSMDESRVFFLIRVGLLKSGIHAVDFYFDKDGVVKIYEVGELTL